MVVIREPKTEHKIENKISQLMSKYKHGNNIHENK